MRSHTTKSKFAAKCRLCFSSKWGVYYRSILKSQQKFTSEKHNAFTEEVIKIVLSANNDEIIQSIDSIETYAYAARKDLLCKKAEIKCSNTIKQYTND